MIQTSVDYSGHEIAQAMKDETFLCDFDDFLAAYGPAPVPTEDTVACKKHLTALIDNLGGVEHPEGKKSGLVSAAGDRSVHFKSILEHVWAFGQSRQKKKNDYLFKPSPRTKCVAATNDGEYKLDACIAEDGYDAALPHSAVIVPIVFGKHNEELIEERNAREEILAVCHRILCDDPRRAFIYAFTLEDTRASLWYLSRTHTVKARSFDWMGRDIDKLIAAFLSFAYATPEQLGVDLYVHKSPRNDGHYIYEFPGTPGVQCVDAVEPTEQAPDNASEELEQPTMSRKSFYLTQECLSGTHSAHISGRVTRIWKAIEIRSLQDTAPADNATPVVIKDVWLPQGHATEGENQERLFADVDAFVRDGVKAAVSSYLQSESQPQSDADDPIAREELETSPAMLQRFIETEPRCKGLDAQTEKRLRTLLTDHKYRELFLTKLHHSKGRVSKPHSEKDNLCPDIFQTDQTKSTKNPTEPARKDTHAPLNWVQRQQNRFVYKEVCLELYQLPTLGDVIDILAQAADALLVMYCAGWVHRDVSFGNILAIKTQSGYCVKLADLEFAQRMGEHKEEPNPCIGTPPFMAWEIMRRRYLIHRHALVKDFEVDANLATQFGLAAGTPHYALLSRTERHPAFYGFTELPENTDTTQIPRDGDVVAPTYQHDLESLWWIALFVVTTLVGYPESQIYAEPIFRHRLDPTLERMEAFNLYIDGDLHRVLRPELTPAFVRFLERLRRRMNDRSICMQVFGQLKNDEEYSEIHGFFSTSFRNLVDDEGDWRIVPVHKTARIEGTTIATANCASCTTRKRRRESDSQGSGRYDKSKLSRF